jgi:type IV pilus assembly protein PilM
MAKALNSVIGLDLGRHSLKSVVMQRRGPDRLSVTNYATRRLPGTLENSDQLAAEIKALMKEMGGASRPCAISISSPEAILRIIEQPETPTHLLREAVRLNGNVLLNQDCREFVLDCDKIVPSHPEDLPAGRNRYLVGGLPRTQIAEMNLALEGAGVNIHSLQLAPVSLFNVFEFAKPELFANNAFFLVDIGYSNTTMLLGARGELVLVRTVDIGGRTILDALMALSGEPRESVLIALDQEDDFMIENARVALANLSREIGSSIGFFEGRREETIGQVFVSGGIAKSSTLMRVLGEEVHMTCTSWNALESCENALGGSQRETLVKDALDLHVACGAAAEVIHS